MLIYKYSCHLVSWLICDKRYRNSVGGKAFSNGAALLRSIFRYGLSPVSEIIAHFTSKQAWVKKL